MNAAIIGMTLAADPAVVVGAVQGVKSKAACERVGGTARPNPLPGYPFVCTYPDRLDRECARKHWVGWLFNVDSGECEPEDDCDLFLDC